MCTEKDAEDFFKELYSPESYFQNFVTAIYQRMKLTSTEPWLSPNEMIIQIKSKDQALHNMIVQYFNLHKTWYTDFCNEQKHSLAEKKLKDIKEHMKSNY